MHADRVRNAYSLQSVLSLCETCVHHLHATCACLAQLKLHIIVLLLLGMFPIAGCGACSENSNLCADSALHVAMQLLVTCLMRDCYQKTSWLWTLDLPRCFWLLTPLQIG